MSKEIIVSDKEIRKGSTALIVQNLHSLAPMTMGAMGGILSVGLGSLYFGLGAAIVGLYGIGVLAVNSTVRKDIFANIYLDRHNKKIQINNQKKIQEVKDRLKNGRAKRQIDLFQIKHNRFEEMLNSNVSETTLAYQRLLGGFDQLTSIALTNIEKISNYESNMAGIDLEYLEREIKRLELKKQLTQEEKDSYDSMVKRCEIRKTYHDNIVKLLSSNETALTRMDEVLQSVTDFDSPKTLDEALEDLRKVANVLNNTNI